MEKKKAKLENWYKIGNSLFGEVYGHHNSELPDGMQIRTSTILNLDESNNTAETLNTIYKLGKKCET